jgi:biotin carboxyl carrier protein
VTFSAAVGGRERLVRVSGGGGTYAVLVDETRYDVDAARTGDSWSLLVGHRSYDVVCGHERSGVMTVLVNGRAVPVDLSLPTALRARPRHSRAGSDDPGVQRGPLSVVAPMPGRIVKVQVRPGDVVEARQGLIVIEAMKMENELRAARPGTVKEVRVAEGDLVEARMVVVVIE